MTTEGYSEWRIEYEDVTDKEPSDRDAACLVLPDLDYDSQLLAIHQLLRCHQDAHESLRREMASLEQYARKVSDIRNELVMDEWADRVQRSVYQDAAHSMAAVGMLAPLIESVFYQAFQGIRRLRTEAEGSAAHRRCQQPAQDQWDCRFVWINGNRRKNVVRGILQLSDATGLMVHLPQDLKHTLEALFEYRNKDVSSRLRVAWSRSKAIRAPHHRVSVAS